MMMVGNLTEFGYIVVLRPISETVYTHLTHLLAVKAYGCLSYVVSDPSVIGSERPESCLLQDSKYLLASVANWPRYYVCLLSQSIVAMVMTAEHLVADMCKLLAKSKVQVLEQHLHVLGHS